MSATKKLKENNNFFDNFENIPTSKNFQIKYKEISLKGNKTNAVTTPAENKKVYIFDNQSLQHNDDVAALKKTFGKFNIKPTVYSNCSLKEINNVMAELKRMDFDIVSAVIIFALMGDRIIPLEKTFMSPLIETKPQEKILIASLPKCDGKSIVHKTDAYQADAMPTGIFKAYSASKGFIQTFCEVMDKYGQSKRIQELVEKCKERGHEVTIGTTPIDPF